MDEATRFLRYVMPGLVSIVSLVLFLLISDPQTIKNLLVDLSEGQRALAATLTVFLGSGVLGYIYAQVYFALMVWCDCLLRDHRSLFGHDGSSPLLRARRPSSVSNESEDQVIAPSSITRLQAWNIVSRYWYAQIGDRCGKDFKGLDKVTEGLTHMIHSVGSTFIGVFLSFLFWLWIRCSILDSLFCSCRLPLVHCHFLCTFRCKPCYFVSVIASPSFVITVVILGLLLYVLWTVWLDARRKLETLVNSHFRERLKDVSSSPVELFYDGE